MDLYNIQNSLKILHGTFSEEIVEQTMVCKFLKPTATVLELGSNIGRNSLVISKILTDSTRLVTLEMDKHFAIKCDENRKLNNLNFNIVNAALSYKPLYYQDKKHGEGGGYCVNQKYNDDYISCPIISFEEIQSKYNLRFDTLVVDCEGGFYFILRDKPSILDNIHTLIIENDFPVIEHKTYVNSILTNKGFKRIFVESLVSESNFPCKNVFWETWQK
jgi:FkbM family methyltransferase